MSAIPLISGSSSDYLDDVTKSTELHKFAFYVCWCTPGMNLLYSKNMKKTQKLRKLVNTVGYYGPMLDVVIRGTIPHVMVLNFSSETKQITEQKEGILRKFLDKYFQESDLIKAISNWFKISGNLLDYETSYRTTRCQLLNSQICFLNSNPLNSVCVV